MNTQSLSKNYYFHQILAQSNQWAVILYRGKNDKWMVKIHYKPWDHDATIKAEFNFNTEEDYVSFMHLHGQTPSDKEFINNLRTAYKTQ